MNTETGVNATFVPNFDIIRDPQPVEPVITDVVQVYDLVGLNINGYVDGKPYYGNVYYVNGIDTQELLLILELILLFMILNLPVFRRDRLRVKFLQVR